MSTEHSNLNFQTIFNYAADPMFLLKEGHFIEANEATLKMFGVSSSNVFLSFHPAALSPEFQRDGQSSKLKTDAMIALAYEKGCHRYEWVYVNLEGEKFDVEVTLTKIEQNKEVFLHVHLRDITQKIAEAQELEKLRERNELAITGSNDGLWDWDVTKNELYLSPRWKANLGYEDHELESSFETFTRVTHPDDLEALMKVVYEHFEKRDNGIEFLVRMKHKNGNYIWLYDKGKALFDEEGKAYRMVGFISDVNDLMLSQVRSSLV